MPGSISASGSSSSTVQVVWSAQNPTTTQDWTVTVYNHTLNRLLTTRTVSRQTSINNSNLTDSSLSSSTTYEYRIYAVRASDGAQPSSANWPSIGYYSASATTSSPPAPPTPAPSFTDTTVAGGILKKSYSDGVAANNASSYAIASGSLPTGLSLNTSNGAITGTPTVQGSFTFAITATGGGGSTGSGNLTIQILPPGNRRNVSDFNSNLAVARRYNGTSWVNLTTMKRFNGTAWVDISN